MKPAWQSRPPSPRGRVPGRRFSSAARCWGRPPASKVERHCRRPDLERCHGRWPIRRRIWPEMARGSPDLAVDGWWQAESVVLTFTRGGRTPPANGSRRPSHRSIGTGWGETVRGERDWFQMILNLYALPVLHEVPHQTARWPRVGPYEIRICTWMGHNAGCQNPNAYP